MEDRMTVQRSQRSKLRSKGSLSGTKAWPFYFFNPSIAEMEKRFDSGDSKMAKVKYIYQLPTRAPKKT